MFHNLLEIEKLKNFGVKIRKSCKNSEFHREGYSKIKQVVRRLTNAFKPIKNKVKICRNPKLLLIILKIIKNTANL